MYVSDASLDEEINQSLAELYDKLVGASPDYFESTQSIDVVADTASYALPDDYYKTLALDILRSDSTYGALTKYNLAERNYDNLYPGATSREWTRYRVRGSYLVLVPTPNWSETAGLRHLYIPAPSRLSNASDTFDGIAGWEDYIIYDVCIKLMAKEESDASQYERLLAKINARIDEMAQSRDVGEPDTIRNLDDEASERLWPRYAPE